MKLRFFACEIFADNSHHVFVEETKEKRDHGYAVMKKMLGDSICWSHVGTVEAVGIHLAFCNVEDGEWQYKENVE